MFVQNKTSYRAALARGNVTSSLAVGALVVEATYRVDHAQGRLVPFEGAREAKPTDPPDLTRVPLWRGVSVTASGPVLGPTRPPFTRTATLAVGGESLQLVISGERRWTRGRAGLVASDAQRFDEVPLAFEQAFGGGYTLPPGIDPVSKLPHPGGKVVYSLNVDGVGLYVDEAAAAGNPLPRIELADQLVRRWEDRPEPGGFSACPRHIGLRLLGQSPPPADPDDFPSFILSSPERFARLAHHAAGRLIFPAVLPGTGVALDGVGPGKLRFEAPPSPVRVGLSPDRRELSGRLRSLHLDATDDAVLCVFAHPFRYRPGEAPEWIGVIPAT